MGNEPCITSPKAFQTADSLQACATLAGGAAPYAGTDKQSSMCNKLLHWQANALQQLSCYAYFSINQSLYKTTKAAKADGIVGSW